MKMTTRLAALLCALLMLLSLAACTKPDTSEPQDDASADAPKVSEEVIAAAEAYGIPTTMPTVRINTEDGSFDFATEPVRDDKIHNPEKLEYVGATISVESSDEQYVINDAEGKVKARGNYTLEYPKKGIRIKFEDKQCMLGLNDEQKFKSWVLLAEWKDISLNNDATAYYLADAILGEDGYYSTDCTHVKLYINDEYWGVYLLAEQQENKEGRANAPEVEDDYTGTDIGYFFEYDAYYHDERAMEDGDPTFEIDYGNYAEGKSGSTLVEGYNTDGMQGYTIKSDIYSDEQLAFIASYMENAYKILYSAVCEDTYYEFNEDYSAIVPAEGKTAQEVVSQIIDVQSLADIYLLNEIVINPDLGWSSFYMSVDMSEQGNHKIVFEAPWDFDSSFGIRKGWENNEGLYISNAWNPNPWLSILHDEQWFMDMVKAKWAEIKEAGVPETAIDLVNVRNELYAAEYEENHKRWSQRLAEGNFELVPKLNRIFFYGDAVDYLTEWLQGRFENLDRELSA